MRPSVRFLSIAFFHLFVLLPAAFAPPAWAQNAPMQLPVHPEPLRVETEAGTVSFSVEVADEPRETQRGLMYRQSLPDGRGMLFIFARETRQSFWMQNTPLPLDLLFIGSDGTVRALERGVPFSTARISPDVQSQFVLELAAGTAQKAGIQVGDRLRHPSIDAAAQGG